LKIALDATYSLDRNLSGVGVYSREILHGLAAAHPEANFLFCYRPHRALRSLAGSLPANAGRRLLWKGWASPASVFHGLNQRIDSSRYPRTVSTFHDLFVMTGDYSTSDFRRRFTQQAREAADRSDLIIAVSEHTANQVRGLLRIDASRIRVIAHGVRRPPASAAAIPREPMILFVGALQRRKNVAALVQAFESTPPDWRLNLAGSFGFGSEEILGHIEASPRKRDIQVLGYVSDADLELLYQRASVFAFPSLDEGFGMPVLEAMARGVPVLTSNGSALPEVCGDAALLVNPADVDSIREGLLRLTQDPSLRAGLAGKGLARSREFSWEKAVAETWRVYQELGRA
jgi:glycosyltransferase involved in cell wall biosynthesis